MQLRSIHSTLFTTPSFFPFRLSLFAVFQGVVVDDDFEALRTKISEARSFTVVHGGVMSKKPKVKAGHLAKRRTDEESATILMTRLKKYVDDSGFRLLDLFKQFDKDKSWSIDPTEFTTGVKVKTGAGVLLNILSVSVSGLV